MPVLQYPRIESSSLEISTPYVGASAETVQVGSGACHYFRVGDIEAEVRDLGARGVTFQAPPHLIATMPDHELWMVFFRDPDGHMLALMEERALRGAG